MKPNSFPFVFAVLMGCTGDQIDSNSDTNVGVDPDDTSESENYSEVSIIVDWAVNGIVKTEDEKVGVCVHKASGETGDEPTLANAQYTGVATDPFAVFNGGEEVRPWIGPATSAKTADGHRILAHDDGFHYFHPLADFTVGADGCSSDSDVAKMVEPSECRVVVNVNVMAAQEGVDYACVGTQGWSGSSSEPDHYEFTQRFVASEGQYFADPDERGFGGLFGTNESLMTEGTTLRMHNTTIGDYDVDPESEVLENGFIFILDTGDIVTHLTCTK